jgi:hypothetical protein
MVETKTSICLILAETLEFETTLVYAINSAALYGSKVGRIRV